MYARVCVLYMYVVCGVCVCYACCVYLYRVCLYVAYVYGVYVCVYGWYVQYVHVACGMLSLQWNVTFTLEALSFTFNTTVKKNKIRLSDFED